MALFGLFNKKSDDNPLRKYAEKVANKRAQAVDRWESIQALSRLGTPEAVTALLPRFTFFVDPSITDQEERDAAFEGVVAAGDAAIEPVCAFLATAESISLPVKMLDRIATDDFVVGKLLELLSAMDIEYERDPQRKIQILATLEERADVRIASTAARFLGDMNETVRFNAVGAVLAQQEAEAQQDAMLDCAIAEESVRVRNRILEGFLEAGWGVGDRAKDLTPKLPAGYRLSRRGELQKA